MAKGDKEGKTTLLKMWTKAEDDQYGLLARDERMVDLAEDAIGKPIYLYSHKMTMKQPNEGGAWEWHQDFGYWYNYGCLAPEMMSIYVALDKATQRKRLPAGAEGLAQARPPEPHPRERPDQRRAGASRGGAEALRASSMPRWSRATRSSSTAICCIAPTLTGPNTYRWGYICSYNAVENAPFKRVREYGNYEPLRRCRQDRSAEDARAGLIGAAQS